MKVYLTNIVVSTNITVRLTETWKRDIMTRAFLIVCWEPELQRKTVWRTWLNVQRCSSEWSACILSWKLQEAFFPEQPEKLMRSMRLVLAKRFVPKIKQIWRMWTTVITRMNSKWRPWHLWLYCVCPVALRIVWKSNKLGKQIYV